MIISLAGISPEAVVARYLSHPVSDRVRASPDIRGGQTDADAALNAFDVAGYAATRNQVLPESACGASRLSPYIRHGLLSLREVWNAGAGPAPDVSKRLAKLRDARLRCRIDRVERHPTSAIPLETFKRMLPRPSQFRRSVDNRVLVNRIGAVRSRSIIEWTPASQLKPPRAHIPRVVDEEIDDAPGPPRVRFAQPGWGKSSTRISVVTDASTGYPPARAGIPACALPERHRWQGRPNRHEAPDHRLDLILSKQPVVLSK